MTLFGHDTTLVRALIELAIYLALTAAIILLSGRHQLQSDRRVHWVAIALLVLLPLGQALRNPRLTYPFDAWMMYAVKAPKRSYIEVSIVDDDGRLEPYPFERITLWSPGPLDDYSSPSPLSMRLVELKMHCRCSENDPRLDQVLSALAAIETERSGRPISELRIDERPVQLGASGSPPERMLYRWIARTEPR